jgi:hypothetical protein
MFNAQNRVKKKHQWVKKSNKKDHMHINYIYERKCEAVSFNTTSIRVRLLLLKVPFDEKFILIGFNVCSENVATAAII